MNYLTHTEEVKSDIMKSISLLRDTTHLDLNTWKKLSENLLRKLDIIKVPTRDLIEQLENLAITLMWRVTTKITTAQVPQTIPYLKDILSKIKSFKPSSIVMDGINEYLLTPEEIFFEKNLEKDLTLLKQQLEVFQQYLTSYAETNLFQNVKIYPDHIEVENPRIEEEKSGAEEIQSWEYEDKNYSCCILDLQGNFRK